MYLNDVFDADIDAQERPDRPIPSGRVTRSAVRNLGFLALVLGAGLVGTHAGMVGAGMPPVIAAIATVGTIVIYDAWHKGNPVAPAIMGLCRVGVYAMAALSVAPTLGPDVLYGAGLLLAYVVGLTYVAAHENKSGLGRTWPLVCLYAPIVYSLPLLRGTLLARGILAGFGMWVARSVDFAKQGVPSSIKTAVVSLIAGISLLDALLIARAGQTKVALLAVLAFGLTLVFQRRIAGT